MILQQIKQKSSVKCLNFGPKTQFRGTWTNSIYVLLLVCRSCKVWSGYSKPIRSSARWDYLYWAKSVDICLRIVKLHTEVRKHVDKFQFSFSTWVEPPRIVFGVRHWTRCEESIRILRLSKGPADCQFLLLGLHLPFSRHASPSQKLSSWNLFSKLGNHSCSRMSGILHITP